MGSGGLLRVRLGAGERIETNMATFDTDAKLIRVTGENAGLIDLLRGPLFLALGDRGCFYEVSVDSVGRVGEVLVSITGSRGHVPLFFGADELEPGYVSRVVRDTVSRFGL